MIWLHGKVKYLIWFDSNERCPIKAIKTIQIRLEQIMEIESKSNQLNGIKCSLMQ